MPKTHAVGTDRLLGIFKMPKFQSNPSTIIFRHSDIPKIQAETFSLVTPFL